MKGDKIPARNSKSCQCDFYIELRKEKRSGYGRFAAVRREGGVPFSKRTFLDEILLRTKPKSGPLEKIQIVFE
jgi:hypothetical protein